MNLHFASNANPLNTKLFLAKNLFNVSSYYRVILYLQYIFTLILKPYRYIFIKIIWSNQNTFIQKKTNRQELNKG